MTIWAYSNQNFISAFVLKRGDTTGPNCNLSIDRFKVLFKEQNRINGLKDVRSCVYAHFWKDFPFL